MRTIPRLTVMFAVLVAAPSALGVLADEGRIPVFQKTTITQPGHYIVTRDFSVSSGVAITIDADNVTLDLNTHTVTGSFGAEAIGISLNKTNITIRNGRIDAGVAGVFQGDGSCTLPSRVSVENMEVIVFFEAIALSCIEYVEIVSSRFSSLDVAIDVSTPGTFTGRILDNAIQSDSGLAIELGELEGGQVRGNVLTGRMRLVGNNNVIANNTVSGSSSDGLVILGSRNLLEGNESQENPGCGIRFNSGSSDNAYRNNMLRGNTGGAVCDSGTGNTDAGGNIP